MKLQEEFTKVYRAVSREAIAIEPFQYFSEIGECIFRGDIINQECLGTVYAHFDAERCLLATLVTPPTLLFGEEANLSWDDFQSFEDYSYSFGQMLVEMHLLATSNPYSMRDQETIGRLKNDFPDPPVIIGGCGRSGTTLLLSILASHPAILGVPEELYLFYPYPFHLQRLN